MTWGVDSLSTARDALTWRIQERMDSTVWESVDRASVPVVLALVPEHLPKAAETVAAYGYWDDDSSHYLDIVFCGWLFDSGHAVFDPRAYRQCVEDVRQLSFWKPTGDIDLLLLNFECGPAAIVNGFDFARTISLPVGKMIAEGQWPNIQIFMQALINHARDAAVAEGRRSSVWEIRERLALDRGRRSLWQWVSRAFLHDAGRVYDEMRHYAICNLARSSEAD